MISRIDDERFEFSVYLPNASSVELAADFTGWRTPIPMRRGKDGWWRLRTTVPSGDHQFVYFVNGGGRMPDYAAHGVRLDNSGGIISLAAVIRWAANTKHIVIAEEAGVKIPDIIVGPLFSAPVYLELNQNWYLLSHWQS